MELRHAYLSHSRSFARLRLSLSSHRYLAIGSTFAGVDTANATFLVILEALLLVTASGDLELKIASEVAGSAVRLMAQSCLELVKIA